MTEGFGYEKDEKVLCFHGPLLYDAKILDLEFREGRLDEKQNGHFYKVHYMGWKSSWDEWVPPARIMKHNPDNIRKQMDLKDSLTSKKKTPAPEKKEEKKKRPRESLTEKEEEYLKMPEVKIYIPDTLKVQLVNDWESITKGQQLVSLPRNPTVSELIERYRRLHSKGDKTDEILDEILDGLKAYFDKALPNILLYRFERQQLSEIKKRFESLEYSDIYGSEHLLRLFVQMPTLIAHSNMDGDAVNILKHHFSQILAFMEKNQDDLFLEKYENATPGYIESAKSN